MKNVRLWIILAVALGLRAALYTAAVQDRERAFAPDSWEYWILAANLTGLEWEPSDHVFLIYPGEPCYGQWGQEVFRTPGYPTFLTITWLHRHGPHFPVGWSAALAIQLLVDAHLVLLTFLLGRALIGEGAGLVAAALQAISPLAIAACCRVLSDSLFAFLLTASLLLIVRHFRTGGWWALVWSALLLGAACYVRPIGLPIAGAYALVLLFRSKRLRRTAAFVCVTAACIAPWVARNVVVADFVGFSSVTSEGLYYYSAAEVVARTKGIPVEEARRQLIKANPHGREAMSLSPVPWNRTMPTSRPMVAPGVNATWRRQRALEIIAEHPWLFAQVHLGGCLAFWLPGATEVLEVAGYTTGGKGTLEVLHTKGLWAAAEHYFGGDLTAMLLAGAMALVLLVKYFGVAVCLLVKCRPRMPAAAWLMGLIVLVSFLLPGPAAHPRFRVPVEPILSIAAAVGWCVLIAAPRRRRAQRVAESTHEDQ